MLHAKMGPVRRVWRADLEGRSEKTAMHKVQRKARGDPEGKAASAFHEHIQKKKENPDRRTGEDNTKHCVRGMEHL